MIRTLFTKDDHHEKESLSVHRVEALYDGVLAIAMTLLVLDIDIPATFDIYDSATLLNALSEIHLTFIDYFISFFIIASFWVGNNTEFRFIKKTDHSNLWLMLITLFFIALIPFTTSLQNVFSGIALSEIIFHINVLIIVVLKYARWEYIVRNKQLLNIEQNSISETLLHVRLARRAILIPLAGIMLTFIIKDYSNLIYIAFFFLRVRIKQEKP